MLRSAFAVSFPLAVLAILTTGGVFGRLLAADDYQLGPDSMVQEGVPQGTVTKGTWESAKTYPGTVRDYWIYVPAQYDKSKPAAVMVFQDGGNYVNPKGQFRVPTVFDNLIHKVEMPVTIGIFLNPGVIPPAKPGAQSRRNRSFEYDTVSDQYAKFLLEEILPMVGETYNLTDDPNQRAICGISSGGICAVYRGLGASRCVSESPQPRREFYEHPRRLRLSRPDPQNRTQTPPRIFAGWFERSRQPARKLAARQPANGRCVQVRQVRLQIRARRRRPQRQTRRGHPPRFPPLALAIGMKEDSRGRIKIPAIRDPQHKSPRWSKSEDAGTVPGDGGCKSLTGFVLIPGGEGANCDPV